MKKSIFTTPKVKSKMKKTTFTIATAFLLIAGGLKAQSIPEGMNHLYAGRIKSAQTVFEKCWLLIQTTLKRYIGWVNLIWSQMKL